MISGISGWRGRRWAVPVLGECEDGGGLRVVEAGPLVRIPDETCTGGGAARLGCSARRTLSHRGGGGGHRTPVGRPAKSLRGGAGGAGGSFRGGAFGGGPVLVPLPRFGPGMEVGAGAAGPPLGPCLGAGAAGTGHVPLHDGGDPADPGGGVGEGLVLAEEAAGEDA